MTSAPRSTPLAFAALALGSACAPGPVPTEEISQPSIYGVDDRMEAYLAPPGVVSPAALYGTGLLMDSRFLPPNGPGQTLIKTLPYADDSTGSCSDVRFRLQPFAMNGVCGAFVVAPDLVATGKHCAGSLADAQKYRVVFDFRYTDASNLTTSVVTADSVYSIVEYIPALRNDTVLLRLDRPASYIRVMPTRRTSVPPEATPIYSLNYPEGLPLKYSANSTAQGTSDFAFFQNHLDLFHGSSGSPIINQTTNVVEGVVSSGAEDWVLDTSVYPNCMRPKTYSPYGAASESAAGTVALAEYLPKQNKVAAGLTHTCAAGEDRTVKCWGANGYGQLGNGTTTDSLVPIQAKMSKVVEIAAGAAHSCARTVNQTVYCWGRNTYGQLGTGTTVDSSEPQMILNLRATTLALGGDHSCAIRTDGTAVCWGDDRFGQLGDNSSATMRTTPTPVAGLGGVIAITAGSEHSCAITRGRAAFCWGRDTVGELGSGTPGVTTGYPVRVSGLTGALQIAAGDRSTCALKENASPSNVYCWGSNTKGQLGTGDQTNRSTATLTNMNTAVAIEVGKDHSCARNRAGDLYCWGDNAFGGVGDGGAAGPRLRPTLVSGVSKVESFEAGYHTCARNETGQVWCWGDNTFGEIGNGTRTQVNTPTRVIN